MTLNPSLDILNAAYELQLILQNLDLPAFAANREKQLATLYCFVVIGEATKRISAEFRAQHPTVPWRNMAGMRDVMSHQYDKVNLDTVWFTAKSSIPQLITALEPLLPSP